MIAIAQTRSELPFPPVRFCLEGVVMKKPDFRASRLPVRAVPVDPETLYGSAPAESPARDTANFPSIADRSLALDWLLTPKQGSSLSERVLARLIQAEAHEAEASLRTDIRIAWQIVLHCMKGDAVECSPAVLAWYQVVGCHPDQFYDKLMIRRAAMFGTEINRVKFPKKSARSIPAKKERQA